MLTALQFTRELNRSMGQYKQENRWFLNGVVRSTYDFTRRREDSAAYYIRMAWTIYENVMNGYLDHILLGNSRIRMLPEKIKNFGILSTTLKAQDADINRAITQVIYGRSQIAAGAANDLKTPAPATHTGSILSSQGWSPMMNDAMIIAGATKGIDFIYTLSDEEEVDYNNICHVYGKVFKPIPRPNINSVAQTARWNQDRRNQAKTLWQAFFKKNIYAIWRGGLPRVFVREMLGLQQFGYIPIMDEGQITFTPAIPGPAANVSFDHYLQCLRQVNYHTNDRNRIVRAISNYLFNDNAALSTFMGENSRVHL